MARFYDNEETSNENRHEIVLDAGKLIFICLIVVLLSGSIFMAGYILGKMQAGSVAASRETNRAGALNDAGSADSSNPPERAGGLTLAAAPAEGTPSDDTAPVETEPAAPAPSDRAAQ
jgi:hypothetical protein